MQRRGQPTAGGEIVPRALGPDEVQRVGAIETILDARAAAEVEKAGAAAHCDVLAVVDPLAGVGIDERAGPAAEPAGLLKQFDPQAAFHGGDGGGQPGQPAADDGDGGGRKAEGGGGRERGEG